MNGKMKMKIKKLQFLKLRFCGNNNKRQKQSRRHLSRLIHKKYNKP